MSLRGAARPRERLERVGSLLGRSLPYGARLRLAGSPVRADGAVLDSQLQLMLALRARAFRQPPTGTLTPAEVRARVAREARVASGRRVPVGAVRDLTIPGSATPLRARHYQPPEGQPAPLLVFLHGGGFVTCDLETHDPVCRLLSRHAGVHVLSVDYRLAPEHPFPAAVQDARAALRWAFEHAGVLGADPSQVAVGGDSAGGNLATVACGLAATNGEQVPVAQLLVYPATDRVQDYRSMRLFGSGFFLTAEEIAWDTAQYATGVDLADARISPLLATDLSRQPPAIVATAGFDPLRDEGEAYANTLRAAGVRTLSRRFPTLLHGFANMTGISDACHDAIVEIGGTLRAFIATTGSER